MLPGYIDANQLLSRQDGNNSIYGQCWGGLGQGECFPADRCAGILYTNQCTESSNHVCCLNRECTVPQGTGWCKDRSNQTCADGTFFSGTQAPWPCPGGNSIQCCVKYADMTNGTSSTTTSSTTTSATATATGTSTPVRETGSSGLTAAQIGGIVGGVVGFVVVVAIVVGWVLWRRRRRRKSEAEGAPGGLPDGQGGKDAGAAVDAVEKKEEGGEGGGRKDDVPILDGQMRQEMDAQGRAALYEIGTGGQDVKGAVQRGSVSELPGEMGVAELSGERER
ncbi:hypothetical protein HFD88_009438 [Aspergillus terreus]|nr:hypothetical protein HFD88_009438 [Aspergillus terreus]